MIESLLLALLPLLPTSEGPEAKLELRPVELPLRSGGTATVFRGDLTVPIVRDRPDSKPITVDVWHFPALEGANPNTPPIFRLYGGPGWPGMEPHEVDYEGELVPLLRMADLVIVGQRGIGTSKPNTVCPPRAAASAEVETSREQELVDACRECREHWESQGYDLTGLNVIEAAADVDDVRRLLGFEKVTLWGGSFGSHWGMAVMRYHPDSVARALLHGVEGPDHTYDMPSGVLASLERMAAEAELSPQLASHVPEEGLIEAFRRLIEEVEEHPIELEVAHPTTGEPTLVTLEADDFRAAALGLTSRASSRQGAVNWAADILGLLAGNFEPAARAKLEEGDGGSLGTASFFMLDCGSGITAERLAVLQKDPAAKVVGDLGWWYQTACSAWGSDLGDGFRRGFATEIPTVIVHGTWDVNTPFDNALELLPAFDDAHFVVVEGGSHGALSEAMRESPPLREAVNQFVLTGDRAAFPDVVELPPLNWAPPRL